MESRAHAIIAVGFVIGLSIAAVLVYYWLAHAQAANKMYKIVTSESVSGLAEQSLVSFKGLNVGRVDSIHFDPQDRTKVVIVIGVKPDTLVTKSTYAELEFQGLTGQKSLSLKLGKGSRKPLKTNSDNPARIPLHPSLLSQLQSVGERDLKKINRIISNAEKVLNDRNRKHLAATAQQLDEATRQVVTIERQLMPVVKMLPDLADSARRTLDQSHTLLAQANDLVRAAKQPVRDVGKAAENVQQLSATGERLTLKAEQKTLPDIESLIDTLSRTSRSLDQLTKELEAKPQSLIFGPPKHPPGPGERGFQGPPEQNNDENPPD